MERVWEEDSPHANFFRRLLNSRVDELVNSPTWLKRLRYNNDEVKWWQKNCGDIFDERGLNLYQLIASSHGECWDNEDEQKCAHALEENVVPPMVNKKPRQNAVSLDHPREVGVRERESKGHVVQTGDGSCEVHLQEGGQGCRRETGGGRPQEEATREKKKSQ